MGFMDHKTGQGWRLLMLSIGDSKLNVSAVLVTEALLAVENSNCWNDSPTDSRNGGFMNN